MSTPHVPEAPEPHAPAAVEAPESGGEARETSADAPGRQQEPSVVGRLLAILKREPVLFVSGTYILVSFMGLWSLYWFYRGLGLPILDYLQGSDLFIAGLRRPDYGLTLLSVFMVLWLSSQPLAWAERHPECAQAIRETRWWGKLAFPEPRGFMGLWGIRTDTLLAFSFLCLSMYLLFVHSSKLAEGIVEGKPHAQEVQLTLAGESTPLPGRARLLGTTSAFIMVWWLEPGRVEALPIANISRIKPVAEVVAADRTPPAAAAPATTAPSRPVGQEP